MRFSSLSLASACLVSMTAFSSRAADPVFDGHADIGSTAKAGSLVSEGGRFRVSGGGDNMWFTNDAFHFAWKKMSGDVSLAADISFTGTNGNAHRKACLLIRQSLDAESSYVDVARHGDGLTSLQFRDARGGLTREVQTGVTSPKRVRLEKHGSDVILLVAGEGEPLHPSGAAIRMTLQEPFYVGLGVCAHDNKALEEATFSKVELKELPAGKKLSRLISAMETLPIGSKDRRVVYWTTNRIEAPNWSPDGASFYFNSKGHILRLPVAGGEPVVIDTGFAVRCNNDHGISPDGKTLVISDQTQERKSIVYTLPITGGTPKRITATGPSYWHGWSPDGRTLAFCGERNGEFDVYTISVDGGEEKRLTTAMGLDDGPEYSPDGKFIYFNSERSGSMQIWRMRPDGSGQEAVTSDEYNNWFAHPSPDGKWLSILSYGKDVKGHPEGQDVLLRLMPVGGGKMEVLARMFGGQGTINVPSWSPDSKKIAFVSYSPSDGEE